MQQIFLLIDLNPINQSIKISVELMAENVNC
jgi:hypothetical protein